MSKHGVVSLSCMRRQWETCDQWRGERRIESENDKDKFVLADAGGGMCRDGAWQFSAPCRAKPAINTIAGKPYWTSLRTRLYYQRYRNCIARFACTRTKLTNSRMNCIRSLTTCCGKLSFGTFGATSLMKVSKSPRGSGSSTSTWRGCLIVFIILGGVVVSLFPICRWRTFGRLDEMEFQSNKE